MEIKKPNFVPHFEPSGKDVKIDDLVNIDKYVNLVMKIDKLKIENQITEEEYKFLILAATRFLEFSYSNIAEYYCKASKEMQKIMEEELLVLIDIDNRFADSVIFAKDKVQEFIKRAMNESEINNE